MARGWQQYYGSRCTWFARMTGRGAALFFATLLIAGMLTVSPATAVDRNRLERRGEPHHSDLRQSIGHRSMPRGFARLLYLCLRRTRGPGVQSQHQHVEIVRHERIVRLRHTRVHALRSKRGCSDHGTLPQRHLRHVRVRHGRAAAKREYILRFTNPQRV